MRNGGVSGSTFTATKGVAAAGDTYAYMDLDKNGNYEWTNLATVDECVVKDKSTNVYYAKPKDYVAITSATEDGDHLFHSVTGNRLFIQQTMEAGCQWWEVTRVGETSVYHCATNDTYYEYKNGEWQEKVVHVTFYFTDPKDDAVNKKKVLEVNYGAKPDASIVSNPSKTEDAAATYQFYGWKSSDTETEYAYTAELENAFEDMYYLPVFTTITKKYTITFKKAKNNTDVPVECFYGQSPDYAASWVSSAQYDYEFTGWKAADNAVYPKGTSLPAVTGATYYTAQWTNHTRSYDITWVNGDKTLEVDEEQPYGTVTAYNGATPTKAADDDYAYAFFGWHNSITNAPKANNETVTGAIIYTAQYSTTPRYAVTFNNYDGTQLARTVYTQGETPAYVGTPARKRDSDGYYNFIGWKNSNGADYGVNVTLPEVTKKETYTAQYAYVTDLFTITLNNVDGKGTSWSGKFGVGSMPFYDPDNNDVPVTPAKAGTNTETWTFTGWDPELAPVTGDAEYTAQFVKETRFYTITWKNKDGEILETTKGEWGATPAYPTVSLGTPTYTDGSHLYQFKGWSPEVSSINGDATYTAQYDQIDNLVVNDNQTININAEVTTTTVKVNGKLDISSGKALTTGDLILEATPSSSGEITGDVNADRAYFEFSQPGGFRAKTWYAVAVPWQVDASHNDAYTQTCGISAKKGSNFEPLALGRQVDLIYYDGALRASAGHSDDCWKYVELDGKKEVMQPGKAYMFLLLEPADVVRFERKAGAALHTNTTTVSAHGANNKDDANWNGIANPATYKAYLNAGTLAGYKYNGSDRTYTLVDMDKSAGKLPVGQSVYVQAPSAKTVMANAKSYAAAPRRIRSTEQPVRYDVYVSGDENFSDRVIIRADEEKEEDIYTIGEDLVKFEVSSHVPQMWVDRYNTQLGVNTALLSGNTALFPLGISVPQTGEYTISVNDKMANEQMENDYLLYLTIDGRSVWNITYAPYTTTLEKGTTNRYGLKLVRNSNAPAVTTDIQDVQAGTQAARKILLDGQVYILRGNNVYSVDGQLVK